MTQNKKLSSLIKITKGKKVIFGDTGKHSYIDIKCLRDDNVNGYTDEKGVFCTKKDIVIAWDGSKSGTVGYGLEGVIGSTLAKLEIIDKEVDTKYVGEFLRSNYKYLNGNVSGVAIPHLKKEFLINLEIPLPDIDTQRLIVSEIEKQFSRLDEGLSSLVRIIENLKSYRASLLKSAVEGRLTADWRTEHPDIESADILLDRIHTARREKWLSENQGKRYKEPERVKEGIEGLSIPKEWSFCYFHDICEIISGFSFKSGDFTENGIPVIKISNIGYGVFLEKNQEYLPTIIEKDYTRFLIRKGDTLFALTRPITNNLVKVCIYDRDIMALLNQRVCKLVESNEISKSYLLYFMQSDFFKRDIKSKFNETLQPNLSALDLGLVIVTLPPLSEQDRIVEILEEKFSVIDSLESLVNANIRRAENLKQAILKKAFSGELVQE